MVNFIDGKLVTQNVPGFAQNAKALCVAIVAIWMPT